MAVAFAGIVIMFADSLDAGRLAGNLLAIGVSVLFALNVTVLRKVHATVDMLPMVMIAGMLSIVVALPLALPLAGHAAATCRCWRLWAACSWAPAACCWSRHRDT